MSINPFEPPGPGTLPASGLRSAYYTRLSAAATPEQIVQANPHRVALSIGFGGTSNVVIKPESAPASAADGIQTSANTYRFFTFTLANIGNAVNKAWFMQSVSAVFVFVFEQFEDR